MSKILKCYSGNSFFSLTYISNRQYEDNYDSYTYFSMDRVLVITLPCVDKVLNANLNINIDTITSKIYG